MRHGEEASQHFFFFFTLLIKYITPDDVFSVSKQGSKLEYSQGGLLVEI
jgi:hypothetical protein